MEGERGRRNAERARDDAGRQPLWSHLDQQAIDREPVFVTKG